MQSAINVGTAASPPWQPETCTPVPLRCSICLPESRILITAIKLLCCPRCLDRVAPSTMSFCGFGKMPSAYFTAEGDFLAEAGISTHSLCGWGTGCAW